MPCKALRNSPRAENSYNKFFNKNKFSLDLIEERERNINHKKYYLNHVKGELRSHIDFTGEKMEERKLCIRPISVIQKQNPNIHKDSKDDRYFPKGNSLSKVKASRDKYMKNPINNNDFIGTNKLGKKFSNFPNDSSNIDCSMGINKGNSHNLYNKNHEDYYLSSKLVNIDEGSNKKSFKNRVHLFDNKYGFYM
jgi:hypothetical protein